MGLNTTGEYIALIFPIFFSFIYFFQRAWNVDYSGVDTLKKLILQWIIQFVNFSTALFFYYEFALALDSMVRAIPLHADFQVITRHLFTFGFVLITFLSLLMVFGSYKFIMVGLKEFKGAYSK